MNYNVKYKIWNNNTYRFNHKNPCINAIVHSVENKLTHFGNNLIIHVSNFRERKIN